MPITILSKQWFKLKGVNGIMIFATALAESKSIKIIDPLIEIIRRKRN